MRGGEKHQRLRRDGVSLDNCCNDGGQRQGICALALHDVGYDLRQIQIRGRRLMPPPSLLTSYLALSPSQGRVRQTTEKLINWPWRVTVR
jgi:hypothetical protein